MKRAWSIIGIKQCIPWRDGASSAAVSSHMPPMSEAMVAGLFPWGIVPSTTPSACRSMLTQVQLMRIPMCMPDTAASVMRRTTTCTAEQPLLAHMQGATAPEVQVPGRRRSVRTDVLGRAQTSQARSPGATTGLLRLRELGRLPLTLLTRTGTATLPLRCRSIRIFPKQRGRWCHLDPRAVPDVACKGSRLGRQGRRAHQRQVNAEQGGLCREQRLAYSAECWLGVSVQAGLRLWRSR